MRGSGLIYEEKSKIHLMEHGRRSCRNCYNFMRVGKTEHSTIRKRGFCILGQGEGSFTLYLSCSGSGTCPSFTFDVEAIDLTNREDAFSNKSRKYGDAYAAKRIAVMKNNANKTKSKHKVGFFDYFMIEMELRAEGIKEYHVNHWDEYTQLLGEVDLFYKEYLNLLDSFTKALVERFKPQPDIKLIGVHRKSKEGRPRKTARRGN